MMWHDLRDWQTTFFRFDGRFNRARYWLHSVLAFAVTAVLELLMLYMFPIPEEVIDIIHSDTVQQGLGMLIIVAPAVTFIYISTAISVKRLHDRDKSGWWALLYLGLPTLVLAAIVESADENHNVTGWPAFLIVPYAILLIVTFVELACLKGTAGTNRFGPDPLAAHPAHPGLHLSAGE